MYQEDNQDICPPSFAASSTFAPPRFQSNSTSGAQLEEGATQEQDSTPRRWDISLRPEEEGTPTSAPTTSINEKVYTGAKKKLIDAWKDLHRLPVLPSSPPARHQENPEGHASPPAWATERWGTTPPRRTRRRSEHPTVFEEEEHGTAAAGCTKPSPESSPAIPHRTATQ